MLSHDTLRKALEELEPDTSASSARAVSAEPEPAAASPAAPGAADGGQASGTTEASRP